MNVLIKYYEAVQIKFVYIISVQWTTVLCNIYAYTSSIANTIRLTYKFQLT